MLYLQSPSISKMVKYFGEFMEYSLDEKKVGKWVDGKSVYRKVYTNIVFNSTVNADTPIHNVSELNIDTLIALNGITELSKASHPNGRFGSSCNNLSQITYDKASGSIYIYCSNPAWASGNMNIIIEYTKTTD